MKDLDSAIRWRPWSVAIVLVLFISLFALAQFNYLVWTFPVKLACAVLFLSMGWNIYILVLARLGRKPGWDSTIADGLLLAGLILLFWGVFF
jgi:hypothetical protein